MKDKNLPVRSLLKGLVVAATICSLVQLGMPRSTASPARLSLKSESQVRSEGSLYDTAIREIRQVETMKLTTADEFTKLKSILERHVPNLKFNRSKLVSLALSESTLISAAKGRTSTTAAAEEFARELAADSQAIFRLNGGAAARDKINRSVEADVNMLGRVSDKVKQAAAQFKSPAHHATLVATPNFQRSNLRTTIATVVVASLVVSAVMIACPPLALALPFLVTAAIGGVVTAAVVNGAVTLVARIAANVGTEEGRDKFDECVDVADTQYHSCVENNPIVALMGGCLAQWLLASALCLTAE